MDIQTLNAVIEMLTAKVEHHKNMLQWSIEKEDDQAINMWSVSLVEVKETLESVQKMLDNELAKRVQEAA